MSSQFIEKKKMSAMFTEACAGNRAEMVLFKEQTVFYTVSTLTC